MSPPETPVSDCGEPECPIHHWGPAPYCPDAEMTPPERAAPTDLLVAAGDVVDTWYSRDLSPSVLDRQMARLAQVLAAERSRVPRREAV